MSEWPSEPIIVTQETEPGIGSKNCLIDVGEGRFEVLTFQIDIDSGYAQRCNLGFRYRRGDQTTVLMQFLNGWAMDTQPLCLKTSRIIVGPGQLIAAIQFDVSEKASVVAVYRRISP